MGCQQHPIGTDRVGQCGVARNACGGLRALTRSVRRIDLDRDERDPKAPTFTVAVLRPCGRLWLQSMIDVDDRQGREQLLSNGNQKIQQHTGIEAATERNPIASGNRQVVVQAPEQVVGRE